MMKFQVILSRLCWSINRTNWETQDKIQIPGVEFGPIGGGAHSDEEWVSVENLGEYYQILKDFLRSLK